VYGYAAYVYLIAKLGQNICVIFRLHRKKERREQRRLRRRKRQFFPFFFFAISGVQQLDTPFCEG
jgi:hypothetical protein